MEEDEEEIDRGFTGGPSTSVSGERIVTWRQVGKSASSPPCPSSSDAARPKTKGSTATPLPIDVLELLLLAPVPCSPSPLVSACLAKDREGVVNIIYFYFGAVPDAIRKMPRSPSGAGASMQSSSSSSSSSSVKIKKTSSGDVHRRPTTRPWFRGGMMSSNAGGGLILRWRHPRLETFIDGSKCAKIDEHDIANMEILKLICERDL